MKLKNHKNRFLAKAIYLLLALCLLAGLLPIAPPTQAQTPEYPWWGSVLDLLGSLDLGDPIAANNGSYHFTMPLLDLGGPMGLQFSLIRGAHGTLRAYRPARQAGRPETLLHPARRSDPDGRRQRGLLQEGGW